VAMSTHDSLTPEEIGMLQGLVRSAIRKAERGQAALRSKHGSEYDDTRPGDRLALLEGLYVKLGKDPSRMTNKTKAKRKRCQGHESLDGAHMGETVYCDGSCSVR
jgi:hypothetical protein